MEIAKLTNRGAAAPASPAIDEGGFDLDFALDQILAELGSDGATVAAEPDAAAMAESLLNAEVAELSLSPQDAAVCEGMAAAALAMEDYRAAIRHCTQLTVLDAENFEAWLNLGVAHQRLGELAEAERAYQTAARLRREDARPHFNLGVLRQSGGDELGAREAYRQALAADASDRHTLWNLGLLAESFGDAEEAEAMFHPLAILDEENEQVWFRLGVNRYRREDWPGAAQAFARCLELSPGWKAAELNQGLALLRLGRLTESGEVFERILAEEPDCRPAVVGLTTVALETGAWEKAVRLRRRLSEAGETLPDLTYNLGVVLERQGRLEDALRFYCEALKERPRFAEALLNLGHVLDRMGRRKEATECWKRALGLDAALASAYFTGAGR